MGTKWTATKFRGVRYREHDTRRHGVKRDRYYAITYWWQGKTITEAIGWSSEGVTEKDAASALGEILANQRRGEPPFTLREKRDILRAARDAEEEAQAEAAAAAVTFSDIWHQHYFPQAEADKAPGTVKRERIFYFTWLEKPLGEKPLAKIAPMDVERLKAAMLKAGQAPRTVEYGLAVVRQVFRFSIARGLFHGEDPTRQVKRPRYDNRRHRYLTHDEAQALLDGVRQRSEELYQMSMVSLRAGLRFGEVASLRWEDVDALAAVLRVVDTKGGKNRSIPMTDDLAAMFADMPKGKPGDLVFPARDGGPHPRISPAFMRTVDALGLNEGITDPRNKLTFHSLRHTCASWLVQAGVDLYRVQQILGHATGTMTQRYAHLAPDSLRAAVETLQRAIIKNENPTAEIKRLQDRAGG